MIERKGTFILILGPELIDARKMGEEKEIKLLSSLISKLKEEMPIFTQEEEDRLLASCERCNIKPPKILVIREACSV